MVPRNVMTGSTNEVVDAWDEVYDFLKVVEEAAGEEFDLISGLWTDESCISDIGLRPNEVMDLGERLGFAVRGRDRLVEVAKRAAECCG